MEQSDPYTPPAALQSDVPVSLADLDLSRLTPNERKILEAAYTKPNVSWYMALWQAANTVLAITFLLSSGKPVQNALVGAVITIVGYLALGYWARTWSRLATFLLLGWHVLFTYHLLFNGSPRSKVMMLLPAVIFLIGFIGARAKVTLTRKARKSGLHPMVKPRPLPTAVARPPAKPPGE